MPPFSGKFTEYTGNQMGSFGSMNAKGGNAKKSAARKGGNVGGAKGNAAKSPGRKGR